MDTHSTTHNTTHNISPSPVVDYTTQARPPPPASTSLLRPQSAAVLFVIDGTATRSELQRLKHVLLQQIVDTQTMDSDTLLGIVVCGAAVAVYELGGGTAAATASSADVYPGNGPLHLEERNLIVAHETGRGGGDSIHTYLAPAFVCVETMTAVLDSLPGVAHASQTRRRQRLRTSRLRRNRNNTRGEGRGKKKEGEEEEDDEEEEDEPVAPCPPKRCLLQATEVALALIEANHCNSGHVVL